MGWISVDKCELCALTLYCIVKIADYYLVVSRNLP